MIKLAQSGKISGVTFKWFILNEKKNIKIKQHSNVHVQ